jgi:CDP-diacylglycerol--serine O-phosphatidyltransferase
MFVLPNLLTAGNLLCGVLAILFALTGRIDLAPWLVMIAAALDFFDGFLARKMGLSSELGKQLDSLADMVTFGVVPGIVCFILLIINGAHEVVQASFGPDASPYLYDSFGQSIHQLITIYFADLTGNPLDYAPFHFSGWYLFSPFVALFIPFFSLFRLAKFNIDTRQTDKFLGLPTPANTLFFISLPLMLWDAWGETGWKHTLIHTLLKEEILSSFIVLFSVLLITEIPLIALKFKDFTWKNNRMRFILIGLSVVAIALLSFRAIPVIMFLYLGLSMVDNISRGKASS